MLELLEKLCSIGGVSGREDKVREFIISEIDGFADWRVCTSLIAGFMAKEAVVSTLGVLTGGLRAGAGGVAAAIVFGYLAALLFSSRDKS